MISEAIQESALLPKWFSSHFGPTWGFEWGAIWKWVFYLRSARSLPIGMQNVLRWLKRPHVWRGCSGSLPLCCSPAKGEKEVSTQLPLFITKMVVFKQSPTKHFELQTRWEGRCLLFAAAAHGLVKAVRFSRLSRTTHLRPQLAQSNAKQSN